MVIEGKSKIFEWLDAKGIDDNRERMIQMDTDNDREKPIQAVTTKDSAKETRQKSE